MTILEKLSKKYGFIETPEELKEVVAFSPFQLCLVRCGNGRFIVPADNAQHFMDIINNSSKNGLAPGNDYVRDIAIWNPK